MKFSALFVYPSGNAPKPAEFCCPLIAGPRRYESGIGHIGTHTFQHSYWMWIDAVGTPIGVQQRLMRHSDIRTTMNIYGDAATADMREAHGKIVHMALRVE